MTRSQTLLYLFAFLLGLVALVAFLNKGILSFLPLVYGYALIPLLELMLPPYTRNLNNLEEELIKDDQVYDWLIYLTVPFHIGLLVLFLLEIGNPDLQGWEIAGLIGSMGILCATYGINVGHELGHRTKKHERFLAKVSLLTSLYMHFYIEHNRGHHKRVSTQEDPASARYGENLYQFWGRSVWNSYWSAWDLERERLNKKALPFLSLHNEMLRFQLIQFGLLLLIGLGLGWMTMLYFILAGISGFLTLETVNYIEHYGLSRSQLPNGNYERVQPYHSWNSNHILGRLMLFELSRHSDHHYLASRKYQILRHHAEAPQMPTGYPGMMILSLVPPLWFRVMHKEIADLQIPAEIGRT
ncbi:MAG: alkane 1-monooxygenase [Bacteroidota bacterium]